MGLLRILKHALVKDTTYVSETDRFIHQFDKKHPRRSASQLKEIAKHRHIFTRDARNKIKW